MTLYVTYEQFTAIYGDILTAADFNRLGFEAQRFLDRQTSGVDGVRKLAVAYPTDEYAAESVVQCMCRLIFLSHQIEQAEAALGYVKGEDGAFRSGAVASVSSGNESISYGGNGGGTSAVAAAAKDAGKREELLRAAVREYLGGVQDANGVNLLYGGRYPLLLKG